MAVYRRCAQRSYLQMCKLFRSRRKLFALLTGTNAVGTTNVTTMGVSDCPADMAFAHKIAILKCYLFVGKSHSCWEVQIRPLCT